MARVDDAAQLGWRVGAEDALDLLVNIAGFGTAGRSGESNSAEQVRVIAVHDVATLLPTRAPLAAMLRRGRGGIVTVASPAAFVAAPGIVAYAATKAFMVSFSGAPAAELHGTGVRVQALVPGLTETEF